MRKPRTRRDRRRLVALDKMKTNVNDPTLGGQIQMTLIGLVRPTPGSLSMAAKIDALLKATEKRKEFFLKVVLGAFMILRNPPLERMSVPDDAMFDSAKEAIAKRIARVWHKTIPPEKLEGKLVEWEQFEDLELGYDPAKLPAARLKKGEKVVGEKEEIVETLETEEEEEEAEELVTRLEGEDYSEYD